MPDGQILARTFFPALHAQAQPEGKRKRVPPPAAADPLRHANLLARNALLQSALQRQQTKAADLRSILCSMDIATLSVGPDLKLRLYTRSAGRLLNIGPQDVGAPLALSGPFDLCGTLCAHITAVLGSGIAQDHVVALGRGEAMLCRLLPLHAFDVDLPTVDGVILTFAAVQTADADGPVTGVAGASTDAFPGRSDGQSDGGLAAGYPGLGYGLTLRQHQVLGHVLAGHPSKNIAADLGISQRTVENHRAAIMTRTGATSLPALARLAIGAHVGGDCKPAHARRGGD